MSQGPENPSSENPYSSPAKDSSLPPMQPTQFGSPNEGDATGGVIPYKNVPALLAYYLGIFSFIPCLGLLLAIPAVILGIVGLKKRRENPAVKGSVHAWIGIIVGGFFILVWGAVVILSIVGMIANANNM
jgi:hypothetical protein